LVVTRCPNCHARFRVSDGQLKLAAGQVRCGACLEVFDARQHRLTTPSPKPAAPSEPEQQPVADSAPASPQPAAERAEAAAPVRTESALARPTLQPQTEANEPEARPDLLAGFRAESLQLDTRQAQEPDPIRTSGWLLLALLALFGLGGQLLWFERAQLALYPEFRGLYALICHQVDCSLEQPALKLINNRGLHLQPHAKFRDALNAAIVLENKAPFDQPWPALDLRFTDLKGRLVAQRTFQPDEYLDTDVLNPTRMPPGRPMQINLELASPGRRGTSYELQLVAPL